MPGDARTFANPACSASARLVNSSVITCAILFLFLPCCCCFYVFLPAIYGAYSLLDLVAVPPLPFHFAVCALVVLALASMSGLSCTAHMVAFLALICDWFISLLPLSFPPESLPGDDVLSRLLLRPFPSACFLPCLFILFFVHDMLWCNFLYLVTTAGLIADQLIM